MKTVTEVTININVEKVWEVMGNQFAQVHQWSSNFSDSKPGGNPKFNGLDYSHRNTQTERGETIQELDAFDSQNHSLTYHIEKGKPDVAKSARSTWSLIPINKNTTKVKFEFMLEPEDSVPTEMLVKIEMGLKKSAELLAEELKHYMEENNHIPEKLDKS